MTMRGEYIDTTSHAGKQDDREQTAAWSEWSARRFTQMRVLHEAGLLGPENKEWRNIAEHSVVVNAMAMFLAQTLENSGSPVDTVLVDEASILHDVTKRIEKETGISYASEHDSTIRRDFLEKFDYPNSVIAATEYTGRVPEMFIDDPDEQRAAINEHSLEELIIAYADARVRNTDIVPLEVARDMNKEKVPKDAVIYDEWYRFYRGVENRIFGYMNGSITPEAVTNELVMTMVKQAQYDQSPATVTDS